MEKYRGFDVRGDYISSDNSVPAIVLKSWLGHTNIHITLDTYADVFDRMNFDAMDKFDAYVEKLDEESEG